jgi:TPR repeat protein
MVMNHRVSSLVLYAFLIVVLGACTWVLSVWVPSPDEALVQRAKAGDVVAQDELGLAYSSLQQYRRSVQWWRRAAEQGYAPAQVNLGLMRLIGVGTSKNPWDARRWFLAAAEQGSAHGQNNLALLYRTGEGGERNFDEAVFWFRRAAAQGLDVSITLLGEMYAAGEGVAQDRQQALSWWRKAAAMGHSGGLAHLADAYARGDGVPSDHAMANAMLKRADKGQARIDWYGKIDSVRDFLRQQRGYWWLKENAALLEREGKVDAALVDATAE